jgi:hypothetical protein
MGKGQSGIICPFDADEVWGVNNVAGQPEYAGKRFDKTFAFDSGLEPDYIEGMKKYSPVVSWQPWADIHYPIDEILAEFKTRYFTNTISYMLALAAFLHAKKVSIYGVDVSFGAPYAQENRGVEYWIGRAQQCGVEIWCPDKSHLMRTVYGNLYGELGQCNMLLYLHERINLINVLPRQGDYPTALKAQNAWWVLFPKEDEARAHNVQVQSHPDGTMSFTIFKKNDLFGQPNQPELVPGGAEYLTDVQMPGEVWDFLKGILVTMEKEQRLPFGVITAYEKLVLAKEEPAGKVGERNDPAQK